MCRASARRATCDPAASLRCAVDTHVPLIGFGWRCSESIICSVAHAMVALRGRARCSCAVRHRAAARVRVQALIVKRATEFGEAEVWMNERLSRAAPNAIAPFLSAYADGPPQAGTPLVLIWRFEGKETLDAAMKAKDFPLNMEARLLGRKLRVKDPVQRKLATIKARCRSRYCHARALLLALSLCRLCSRRVQHATWLLRRGPFQSMIGLGATSTRCMRAQVVLRQLVTALRDMHNTGIVHRDVKPQNILLTDDGLKLIDLGACADLRVGINYIPNEYLLDPRFAPPQQYVMSPLTPRCGARAVRTVA
jgi:Protein kinase domain